MNDELSPMKGLIDGMPEPSAFADSIPIPEEARETEVESEERDPPLIWREKGDNGTSQVSGSSATAPSTPDIDDTVFDPNIHTAGKDGNGTRLKSGKFRRKKGYGNSKGTINTPGVMQSGDVIDPVRMGKAKAAAQVCTAATFIVGQMVCGPEGAPIQSAEHGVDEAKEFEQVYTQAFYMSESTPEIPPWILVVLVLGNYTARRMAIPVARNRILRMWDSVKQGVTRSWHWVTGF